MLELISILALCGWSLYAGCSIGLDVQRQRHPGTDLTDSPAYRVRYELKPFSLPLVIMIFTEDVFTSTMAPFDWGLLALGLLSWHRLRHDHDDDDRWKLGVV